MQEVRDHYKNFLAEHYTWMVSGDYDRGVNASAERLRSRLGPVPTGRALDLGSGPGLQAAALLQLGFERVVAVDQCEQFIREMAARNAASVSQRRLCPILGDVLDLALFREEAPFSLVCCLGDTLTHLPEAASVQSLIANALTLLIPGGAFFLSFRDLTGELSGLDRFFSVRADTERIMTCFVENEDVDHAAITDLIYTRSEESGWRLQKSSYRKLRLGEQTVRDLLQSTGFCKVQTERQSGLITLRGLRPPG